MDSPWSEQRSNMLEQQLRRRGIEDERVLDAMARIPREAFVDPSNREASYSDNALEIGFGQTISQPFMTAFMAQCLQLTGTEKVLDVGTGSGYHAALLGLLADSVFSIERVPELAAAARITLQRTGLGGNVTVLDGDGSVGLPQHAPYCAISVGAGAPDVPYPLLDQLQDPGKLVIPVGPRDDQDLQLITKLGGKVTYAVVSHCRFVPLYGSQGWKA